MKIKLNKNKENVYDIRGEESEQCEQDNFCLRI